MVNINIEVPDEIHKKIKILAAIEGKLVKDVIVNALEESVKNEKA